MPELSGPVQPFEVASWLWLVPFFALAGALTNALYCSGFLARVVATLRAAAADDEAGQAPRQGPSPAVRARATTASPTVVARVTVGSLALSAVASIVHVGLLARLPADSRFLLGHVWQMVRVGPVDVGADLALDPLSATLVLLVTLLGTAVAVFAVASGDAGSEGSPWRFFAWFGAFVTAMLVLLLADNALLLLLGWQGVALAGYRLAFVGRGTSEASAAPATRAFLLHRAADVGVLTGVALLFWGLGGAWDRQGDYQAEIGPRLASVAWTPTDAPIAKDDRSYTGEAALKGKGFLSVALLPDSLVYVDESHTPVLDASGLPLRTPFRRHELPGGAHSFRVAPDDTFRAAERESKTPFVLQGGVLTNYSIPRTGFGADHEVALAMLGPTLKFREMGDELALTDARGAHPARDAMTTRRLGGRGIGGLQLATTVCLLVLAGALAKSAQVPFQAWLARAATTTSISAQALVEGAGMVLAGVYLVARLGFVFSLSHTASLALAALGVATALFGATACVVELDLARLLAYSTISQLGLAFVALGAGADAAAVFQVVTHAIVKTCLVLAAGSVALRRGASEKDPAAARDLRAMGGLAASMPRAALAYRVACVALTMVPVPFLAGFWSTGAVMEQAFSTKALPSEVARGVYGLLLVTSALTSFGMWRSYYLVFGGPPPKPRGAATDASPTVARVLTVLAGLAAVSGVVLGVSARDFGGAGESLLEAWLAPVFAASAARFDDVSSGERLALLGVGLAVAYAGWAAARQRYGAGRRGDWAAREVKLPWLGTGRAGAGAR